MAEIISPPESDPTANAFAPHFESNNWTVSGKLTATGAPILAGDPHRAHTIPSLRYMIHLNGPGWNVIGAGEPAIPGVSLGHNEKIAFALTIFSFADEEDIYVYDTNPANPNQYRYKGRWVNMKLAEEIFQVKGQAPKKAVLKFTGHGPVICEDSVHHKAYALRAAWLEHEGTAVYLAGLRLDQARNWREFREAMYKHYCPSLNMVYADVEGNIGWFGGSIAPLRPNWNGLLPVPGDGRFEWKGFLDTKRLPYMYNPEEGFFATANQYNVPEGYPRLDVPAHEWAQPSRFNRIAEVLRSGGKHSVESMMRLQLDEVSLLAREITPLLANLHSPNPEVGRALRYLREWDFSLAKESIPAAIYEIWALFLQDAVARMYIPEEARAIFGSLETRLLVRLITSPDNAFLAFGSNPVAGRDSVLLSSLDQAVRLLREKLGENPADWKWGSLHHMRYEHALSGALPDGYAHRGLLDTDSLPRGGDASTVNNTGFRRTDFRQTSGASYRHVLDLGDWDRSVAINSPGQSGDPRSSHYRDLFPLWAEGGYFPLYFSRARIEEVTEERVKLTPKYGKMKEKAW